jgi:hypothetical protein
MGRLRDCKKAVICASSSGVTIFAEGGHVHASVNNANNDVALGKFVARHRGKRNSEYRTIPTTTAKMTAITIPVMIVRLKIARACGDCGLNTFTTSAATKAALCNCRFTETPIVPNLSDECENIYARRVYQKR